MSNTVDQKSVRTRLEKAVASDAILAQKETALVGQIAALEKELEGVRYMRARHAGFIDFGRDVLKETDALPMPDDAIPVEIVEGPEDAVPAAAALAPSRPLPKPGRPHANGRRKPR